MRISALASFLLAAAGCGASTGVEVSPPDAAAAVDAARDGGAATDGGVPPDAARRDAGARSDAGACNPDAVRFEFLASGPFGEGALCDDLFVCLGDPSEAAGVVAAADAFECDTRPGWGCDGGTCFYRDPSGPGLLDARELATICAVTLVTPTPDVVCVVYGP